MNMLILLNIGIAMPMYNLIEYSDNYSDTSGSLWKFKRDEFPINNPENPGNVTTNNLKSFKYKSGILGRPNNNVVLKNAKIAVPFKYLSTFWQSLKMPLINCKIHLN